MRVILLLLSILLYSLPAQMVLEERFENFSNWFETDSIVYGWMDMGDSASDGAGGVQDIYPRYVNSVRGQATQRMPNGSLTAPHNFKNSPWVRGATTIQLDSAHNDYLYHGLDDGNLTPKAEPDSNLSWFTVNRQKRTIHDWSTPYPLVFRWSTLGGGNRGLYIVAEYNGAGAFQFHTRLWDAGSYDVSVIPTVDTTLVPSGWFTSVVIFNRSVDSLYHYVNGQRIIQETLNRSVYFSPDPGTSYKPSISATTSVGNAADATMWISDHVIWKGVVPTLQQIRGLEVPAGWVVTGNFKPYRRCITDIDTLSTLEWDMGFTSSTVDNAMYKLITLPKASNYRIRVDTFKQSDSATLKFKVADQIVTIAPTNSSATHTAYFTQLPAGADTLWVYGSAGTDSIVVDNIEFTVTGSKIYKSRVTY